MLEKIFVFDEAKFSDLLNYARENGLATIRDGVAYWKESSGKSGIIQHLPLKEVSVASSEQLSTISANLQSTVVGTSLISTGVLLGAIMLQTIYLTKKINQLRNSIDDIGKDVTSLYVINYMTHLSEYAGMIESAKVILKNQSKSEVLDIASVLLTNIACKRNEISLLIPNLISYADKLTDKHLEALLDFIMLVLDLIPNFVYVELTLSDRYEKFNYTNDILDQSKSSYQECRRVFSEWCKTKREGVIKGNGNKIFLEKDEQLRLFFTESKKVNDSLFSGFDRISLSSITETTKHCLVG